MAKTNRIGRKHGENSVMRRFAVLLRIKADTIARDYVDDFQMKNGGEYGKEYSTTTLTKEDIEWLESLPYVTLEHARQHCKKTSANTKAARERAKQRQQNAIADEAEQQPVQAEVENLSFEEQYARMLAEVEAFENEQAEQEAQ